MPVKTEVKLSDAAEQMVAAVRNNLSAYVVDDSEAGQAALRVKNAARYGIRRDALTELCSTFEHAKLPRSIQDALTKPASKFSSPLAVDVVIVADALKNGTDLPALSAKPALVQPVEVNPVEADAPPAAPPSQRAKANQPSEGTKS